MFTIQRKNIILEDFWKNVNMKQKNKSGEPYWWWFRKIFFDESDNKADNDSNDDDKKDESNE